MAIAPAVKQLIPTSDITWDNLGNAFATPEQEKALAYPPAKLTYIEVEGVQSLSYSKLNTLYECPRKFQLRELEGRRSFTPTAHTAFGHAYGAGVQTFLQYAPEPLPEYASPDEMLAHAECTHRATALAVASALAAWDTYDITDTDNQGIKGFYDAVRGIRIFIAQANLILDQYKLHTFTCADGSTKPAVELLVYIEVTEGYSYQMHIDAVLEDRLTGALCVLEIKTGSRAFTSSDYENSSQTMGYCVSMQAHGLLSDRQVEHKAIYLCYNAKDMQMQLFEFNRSLDVGMEWVATLLLDVQAIETYKEYNLFPRRGGSCRNFNRICEHFTTCSLAVRDTHDGGDSFSSTGIEAADIYITSSKLLALC
jgi:hypothetical protein